MEVYVKQNIAFECKIEVVNTPLVWKTVLQTRKKVLFMGIHIALTHTIQDVSSYIYKHLFVMNTIRIIVLLIGLIVMLQVIIGIFSPILLFIFTLVFFLQAFRQ